MKPTAWGGAILLPASGAEAALSRRNVSRWLATAGVYFSLTKPRVVGLVLFTAVAAAFAAAEGSPSGPRLALLLVAGFLASGGAAALNHYFDRDIDAVMGRTRGRPLVTGQIAHPRMVLVAGSAMVGAGVLLAAAFRPTLALFLLAGALVYVAVYTLWLKRRSPLNIVVGGLAGSCAVLGGWVTEAPEPTAAPLLLALLVFLWTPAHFWSLALARSEDYRHAGVPMLPAVVPPLVTARWVAVHCVWTVALSFWVRPAASLGPLYLVVALSAGAVLLWMGVRLLRQPTSTNAWPLFKFSGIYLGLLFIAVLADSVLTRG